jgi:hypothetical protein
MQLGPFGQPSFQEAPITAPDTQTHDSHSYDSSLCRSAEVVTPSGFSLFSSCVQGVDYTHMQNVTALFWESRSCSCIHVFKALDHLKKTNHAYTPSHTNRPNPNAEALGGWGGGT